jgi:metal-sulfur cluster biosynthetic enzyme
MSTRKIESLKKQIRNLEINMELLQCPRQKAVIQRNIQDLQQILDQKIEVETKKSRMGLVREIRGLQNGVENLTETLQEAECPELRAQLRLDLQYFQEVLDEKSDERAERRMNRFYEIEREYAEQHNCILSFDEIMEKVNNEGL